METNSEVFTSQILNSTKRFVKHKGLYRQFQLGTSEEIFERHLPLINRYALTEVDIPEEKDENQKTLCIAEKISPKRRVKFNLRSNYLEEQNKKYDNILTKQYKDFYPVLKRSRIPIVNVSHNTSDSYFNDSSISMTGLPYLPAIKENKYAGGAENISAKRYHNDIFEQTEYAGLIYDEALIFNSMNKLQVEEKMSNAYNEIAINKALKSEDTTFTKTLLKRGRKYYLNFQSMKFTFYENKEGSLIHAFEYFLPFEAIPIFYKNGPSKFIILLSKLFKISGEDYKHIEVTKEAFLEFIHLSLKPHQRGSYSNNNPKMKGFASERIPQRKTLQNLESVIGKVKETTIKGTNESEASNNKLETTNIYRFFWITPVNSYVVDVSMPLTSIQEGYSKVKVSKYIDYNLLFYLLLEKNFENWDFYVMNYLFSFAKCRNIMDRATSKQKYTGIIANSYFLLDSPPKIEEINSNLDHFAFIINLKEEEKNLIAQFNGFKFLITISVIDEKSDLRDIYKYLVQFNFKQTETIVKTLLDIDEERLADFLFKFANIQKKDCTYDFSILNVEGEEDSFNTFIQNIKKYCGFEGNILQKENANSDSSKELILPSLNILSYLNIFDNFEICSLEILELMKNELLNSNIYNWPELLFRKNEEKIGEMRKKGKIVKTKNSVV